ncbi:hypothetical protein C8R43DRAFT_579784 [Mycena crocata]|nr:hypothetical protein C8R43DRAFT_579784 [Mycena crocata]
MAKSTAKYTLLPSADENEAFLDSTSDVDEELNESEETAVDTSDSLFPPPVDPRFNPTPPSPWKRAGLLLLLAFLFFLTFQIRAGRSGKAKIVHASSTPRRYSKEFKYRPAASPIITETLKDGRMRVRGAAPTTSVTPTPVATAAAKTKKRAGKGKKRSGKHRKAKKAPVKAGKR